MAAVGEPEPGDCPNCGSANVTAFAELQFGNLCQTFPHCIGRMTLNITEQHWLHGAQFGPFATLITTNFSFQKHFLKKVLPQLTKPQISTL